MTHISLKVSCIEMIYFYYSNGVYQCRKRRFSPNFGPPFFYCTCTKYDKDIQNTEYLQRFSCSCLYGWAKSSGLTTNAFLLFVNKQEETTSFEREEIVDYKKCLPFSS